MPEDDFDDLDEDEEESEDSPPETDLVRQLRGTTRQQKKMIRDLQKQITANQDASRKLALMEADLPKTKQMDYFLKHYDGEFTAEAIRQAAADEGFLEVETAVTADLDTTDDLVNASRGGWPVAAPGEDAALKEQIMAVSGTNASKKIADLMKAHGRLIEDE